MSIGKIVTGFLKPQNRTALKVATDAVWKNVANGKPSGLKGITEQGVKNLLDSKQAEAFLSRAGDVLSDSIMSISGIGLPQRVITKRLPSGTIVTESFDVMGLAAKEVLGEKTNAISYFINSKLISSIVNKKNMTIVQRLSHTAPARIPGYAKVDFFPLSDLKGLTARANVDNKVYLALEDAGMIPKSFA